MRLAIATQKPVLHTGCRITSVEETQCVELDDMSTLQDLTGQRFHSLTVVGKIENPGLKSQGRYWLCQCDCGNKIIVPTRHFRYRGGVKSCGCHVIEATKKRNDERIGQRFGRLVIIDIYKVDGKRDFVAKCQCDCGNIVEPNLYHVLSGDSQSCICYRHDRWREVITKHGGSHTAEFSIWAHAKERCCNPNDKSYSYYGGRDPYPVTMYEGWINDFQAFFDHVGPRPSPQHSLDRINNLLGYEPGNLRWATSKEQQRNKRNNHLITMNGETKTVTEWCELLNLDCRAVFMRLYSGWDSVSALTAGFYKREMITFNGETMTLFDWAKKLGFAIATLSARLKKGWTIEQILTTPVRKRNKSLP